ncbi:glycosyltransferase [Rhizobium leguminosarum]|nr:glycosyltransferase [Rhizobium leguminosarum]NKK61556.1 glycosyltransferase [Rhizobium leguminosarum bv. viciae]
MNSPQHIFSPLRETGHPEIEETVPSESKATVMEESVVGCKFEPVCIGMPCFNSQQTIQETLRNTLQQTHGEFCLLIYDDGSTDATPDIVRDFERTDSRVRLVRDESNKGRSHARNALLALAGNCILTWQDSDDLWHPQKLSEQLKFYSKLSVELRSEDFIITSPLERLKPIKEAGDEAYLSLFMSPNYYGTLFPPYHYDLSFIFSEAFSGCPFYLQATMGRAAHFRSAGGFNLDLEWHEDLDIAIKLLKIGIPIYGHVFSHGLAYYHNSTPSVSPTVLRAAIERLIISHEEHLNSVGIDIQKNLRWRRQTYLFLGLLRRREFGPALSLLAEDGPRILSDGYLRDILVSNLELLPKAINAQEAWAQTSQSRHSISAN